MHDRVYVDTEYLFPDMSPTSGRPSDTHLREIVQIAAVRVNPPTGTELGHFDSLVRPRFVLPVPTFFTELTGITRFDLRTKGTSFLLALADFVRFAEGTEIWTFDKDWEVLRQNCQLHNLPFPYIMARFTRVKGKLAGWGIVDADSYSSGTLHQAAGIVMEGQVHNALHDVRSMARAAHYFEHRS